MACDSDFLFHTPPCMVLAWSGGATERLCWKTLSYLSTVVSSFEVTKGAKLLLFATGGPGSWRGIIVMQNPRGYLPPVCLTLR